jgi:hypothetical protein
MVPKFEVEWTMQGWAVVEADDTEEAKQILHEGLVNLDTAWFEQFDVTNARTESVEPMGEHE